MFWVAIGGAAGACSRFAVGLSLGRSASAWATLSVNVVGCLLLGFAWQYGTTRFPQWWTTSGAALIATGFCGAFTTMSALALESRHLAVDVGSVQATIYVFATVMLSLAALLIGMALARMLL